jgi:hypothetical protein
VLIWLQIRWSLPTVPADCRNLVTCRVHEHRGSTPAHRLVKKPEVTGPTSCHHLYTSGN